MERWACFLRPSPPTDPRVTGSAAHIALSRKAAAEGMVLLKNDGTLPLGGKRVALFGRGHIDCIKGGGGSGSVRCAFTRDLYDGFLEKEREGKLTVFHPLSDFYADALKDECSYLNSLERKAYAYARLVEGVGSEEPEVPESLMAQAAANADIAVLTISRFSCEKYDRAAAAGDYYLSEQETALLRRIKKHFRKIAVVLNWCAVSDASWFAHDDAIGAALLAWLPGQTCGCAIADVLCGDVNPSGRLTDTLAADYFDYPSAKTFAESEDYVNYYEDIYTGYRRFETIPGAAARVLYPFGFGLSYTSFSAEGSATCKGREIAVTCTVRNTGSRPGREVAQVYLAAPQGKLGKAAKVLAAFGKTRLLQPDETQTMTLRFSLNDFASYDDLGAVQKSAFVLEQGQYAVYLGTNVRDCAPVLTFTLSRDELVRQCVPRAVPTALPCRLTADGKMQPLPPQEITPRDPLPAEIPASEKPVTFSDVAAGRAAVGELIACMTDEELASLLYGHPDGSISPTNGIGAPQPSRLGIPLIPTGDGPAGFRIPPEHEMTATAFPCATLIACSWDTALAEAVSRAIAQEVRENGVGVYLAPALNVHRDPLCGRNYEYYAEDPLLTGRMAAAAVRGAQSAGVAATVKHFACNGRETNRRNSDSRVTERALREIWLRGFEIAVRESKPAALMTAYNLVNGVRSSQNYDLIEGVLRGEWGFDGLVMTDWHVWGRQPDELLAGNDLKMPENLERPSETLNDLPAMLRDGTLPRAAAQQAAKHVLEMILKI
ncbi:MAG: glycoside hydrolase family 3 C-terminal domain-containing protein [Oscillospiraceae bacterium]|nr:glycoside hydrolase family 3 C-terminal domain-containing protein [Oscillospiraceae bacterium]